jgi:hypothetical protein
VPYSGSLELDLSSEHGALSLLPIALRPSASKTNPVRYVAKLTHLCWRFEAQQPCTAKRSATNNTHLAIESGSKVDMFFLQVINKHMPQMAQIQPYVPVSPCGLITQKFSEKTKESYVQKVSMLASHHSLTPASCDVRSQRSVSPLANIGT